MQYSYEKKDNNNQEEIEKVNQFIEMVRLKIELVLTKEYKHLLTSKKLQTLIYNAQLGV